MIDGIFDAKFTTHFMEKPTYLKGDFIMLEIAILVAVMGAMIVAATAVAASIIFAMQVDKKILDMKEKSNSWVDKLEKES